MEYKEITSQKEYDVNKDFDGFLVIKNGYIKVAHGSATVYAYDSARVDAYGSARVYAHGSATVDAYENSNILIHNKNKVKLFQNATLKKWKKPIYTKNIFIEICEKEDGKLVLYKSVNPKTNCDFYTGKIHYGIGKTTTCGDYINDTSIECGNGLHLCNDAYKTQYFNVGKILKCLVHPKDICVYKHGIDKVRCRKVFVVCEVDVNGKEIKTKEAENG